MNKLSKILTAVILGVLLSTVCFASQLYMDSQGVTYTLEGTTAFVGGAESFSNTSRYSGTGDVVIPETVSFEDKTYTVTKIEAFAFYESGVKSVTIPKTVTSIGASAFACCPNLTEINVDANNSVYASVDGNLVSNKTVGVTIYAFADGQQRSFYKLPDNVTKVAPGAFEGTQYLLGVNLNNATEIGAFAFANSSIKTAVCVGSAIKEGVFAGSDVENIALLRSAISSIGNAAFYDCKKLKTVMLPPAKTISPDAFRDCVNLERIVFHTASAVEVTLGDNVFTGVPEDCKLVYRSGTEAFDALAGTFEKIPYVQANAPYKKVSDMLAPYRTFLYRVSDGGVHTLEFGAYNTTSESKTVTAYVAFYDADGNFTDVRITGEKVIFPGGAAQFSVTAPESYARYSIILLDGNSCPVGVNVDGKVLS